MTTETPRTLEEIKAESKLGYEPTRLLDEAYALGAASRASEGRATASRLLHLAGAWGRAAAKLGAMTASGEDMAARDAYEECAEMLRNVVRSAPPEPREEPRRCCCYQGVEIPVGRGSTLTPKRDGICTYHSVTGCYELGRRRRRAGAMSDEIRGPHFPATDKWVAERDEITALRAEVERLRDGKMRAEASFLAATEERDEARASLARVTAERDAARCAEAESHSDLVLARADLVCVRYERDGALARLCDANSYSARYAEAVNEVAHLRAEREALERSLKLRAADWQIKADTFMVLPQEVRTVLDACASALLADLRAPRPSPAPTRGIQGDEAADRLVDPLFASSNPTDPCAPWLREALDDARETNAKIDAILPPRSPASDTAPLDESDLTPPTDLAGLARVLQSTPRVESMDHLLDGAPAPAATGRCSICGSRRLPLDREGTRFGACSLVSGPDGTGGCPDPLRDYEAEEAATPRCERCGGSGKWCAVGEQGPDRICPHCGGTGRSPSTGGQP